MSSLGRWGGSVGNESAWHPSLTTQVQSLEYMEGKNQCPKVILWCVYSCCGLQSNIHKQAHACTYTHTHTKHTNTPNTCAHTHTTIIIIFNNHQKFNFAHQSCEPFLLMLMEEGYSQNAMSPQQIVCINFKEFSDCRPVNSVSCKHPWRKVSASQSRHVLFCFLLSSTPSYMPSPGFLSGHWINV